MTCPECNVKEWGGGRETSELSKLVPNLFAFHEGYSRLTRSMHCQPGYIDLPHHKAYGKQLNQLSCC